MDPLNALLIFAAVVISTRNVDLVKRVTIVSAISLLLHLTPDDQYIGSLIALVFLSIVKDL